MPTTDPNRPKSRTNGLLIGFCGWLVVSFLPASMAAFVSTGDWYAKLIKPSWSPPNWIFGPVWTMLYLSMAVAAWLVWREGGWRRQNLPLIVFILQLILNACWTPLFFGLHWIDVALVEIALLWISIVATIILFWRTSRTAGLLLVPYLAWVSFATVLNYTLWSLNSP